MMTFFHTNEVFMKVRFRFGMAAVLCCVMLAVVQPALAAEVPPDVEKALSDLLAAVKAGPAPATSVMDTVLAYVAEQQPSAETNLKNTGDGTGAVYGVRFNVPLQTLVTYMLDPGIPGDTLFPASVRSNYWYPESDILTTGAAIRTAAFPPVAPLVSRGVEYEETTPDTSSGCYYVYRLNRMFVLTAYKGRTVLLSVSSMPKESAVGRKGLIVGDDTDWLYAYTPTVGTNLPMLGWAETFLYDSASVTVFMESAPGAKTTEMIAFKWAKAGWSGMNVVKQEHVVAGLKRFADSFKTVMESPKRPTPEALKARLNELKALDEAALRAQLAPLSAELLAKEATAKELREKDFQSVIKDKPYVESLNRNQLINELMKQFVRKQLGLSALL